MPGHQQRLSAAGELTVENMERRPAEMVTVQMGHRHRAHRELGRSATEAEPGHAVAAEAVGDRPRCGPRICPATHLRDRTGQRRTSRRDRAVLAARECEVRQTLSTTQRPVGDPDRPSRRVVEQRVRNRIIEYLELASSFEAQQDYERDVPIEHIPYEVISQWEDWVHKDPREDRDLSDVYDEAEVEAMCQFHAAWEDAASAVPDKYPPLSEVQALPEWDRLRHEAGSALSVFMRRGKMSDDHEVA
jgi:hypothetical protein